MNKAKSSIWVFGDYRNYFQNRVTLQLLARAREMAPRIGAEVCAVIFGHDLDEYVGEYIAHGAEKVYALDHPDMAEYRVGPYVTLMTAAVRKYEPEIILVGATDFGREFAPRVAKRLRTGLTADCIGLEINDDGLMVQTAPSFGGNLLADIVTPEARPQMATVRPGTFQELPHDYEASGEVIRLPLPDDLPRPRVRLISAERLPQREQRLEDAKIVICGGRGMGSKTKFKKLFELARLTDGEVGATRPVVHSRWSDPDTLIGQAGRHVSPQILFSFGISGAIQHTAAINDADFIIAVNKNPNAAMMKLADLAIVADANQFCSALIRALKARIRD
ncbi:electron transfer flavoprotein subunit alpha/Fix B family protein [Desulfonema ishimotonii]|uniref:Electron transfer flavoprotein subunit alpha/Fix B family protein n=1 Tax=Desulfonema ishimotonii TaxID=45657 RepID=A0A401FZB5_9BACT|nr:electron transfer flavoprotein subunit alpha/FixB family protein [Desulfonema ishimotonii]GBC62300.1 electron transfer flavoprotein subunit alpha/Fix B family protein [Desulfonema ishimotonii]